MILEQPCSPLSPVSPPSPLSPLASSRIISNRSFAGCAALRAGARGASVRRCPYGAWVPLLAGAARRHRAPLRVKGDVFYCNNIVFVVKKVWFYVVKKTCFMIQAFGFIL